MSYLHLDNTLTDKMYLILNLLQIVKFDIDTYKSSSDGTLLRAPTGTEVRLFESSHKVLSECMSLKLSS